MSITLRMILAVPSNTIFCSIATGNTVPIFSKNPSSLFDTVPRAPSTIGMASTWFTVHILDISIFKSWYYRIFSTSFAPILLSPGIAILMMHPVFFSLSTAIKSGLVCSISWSHWNPTITYDNYFVTLIVVGAHTICLRVSSCISCTISNRLYDLHCHVYPYTPLAPTFCIHLLVKRFLLSGLTFYTKMSLLFYKCWI